MNLCIKKWAVVLLISVTIPSYSHLATADNGELHPNKKPLAVDLQYLQSCLEANSLDDVLAAAVDDPAQRIAPASEQLTEAEPAVTAVDTNHTPQQNGVDYHAIDIEPLRYCSRAAWSNERVWEPDTPSLGRPRPRSRGQGIVEVYQRQEMGRAILGYVIPVTVGLFALNARPSPTVVNLVLVSVCTGFTAIWNGLLLREAMPGFANRLEQFGVADVLAAFVGLISAYVPRSLAWLPWLCWALAMLPLALTFSPPSRRPSRE